MTTFNQATKDYGQKQLDGLIDLVTAAANEACNQGLDDARDKLWQGLGHLQIAKGILGGVTGPEVSTRSGEK